MTNSHILNEADCVAYCGQLEAEANTTEKALREAGQTVPARPARDPEDLIGYSERLEAHNSRLRFALRTVNTAASVSAASAMVKPAQPAATDKSIDAKCAERLGPKRARAERIARLTAAAAEETKPILKGDSRMQKLNADERLEFVRRHMGE